MQYCSQGKDKNNALFFGHIGPRVPSEFILQDLTIFCCLFRSLSLALDILFIVVSNSMNETRSIDARYIASYNLREKLMVMVQMTQNVNQSFLHFQPHQVNVNLTRQWSHNSIKTLIRNYIFRTVP